MLPAITAPAVMTSSGQSYMQCVCQCRTTEHLYNARCRLPHMGEGQGRQATCRQKQKRGGVERQALSLMHNPLLDLFSSKVLFSQNVHQGKEDVFKVQILQRNCNHQYLLDIDPLFEVVWNFNIEILALLWQPTYQQQTVICT